MIKCFKPRDKNIWYTCLQFLRLWLLCRVLSNFLYLPEKSLVLLFFIYLIFIQIQSFTMRHLNLIYFHLNLSEGSKMAALSPLNIKITDIFETWQQSFFLPSTPKTVQKKVYPFGTFFSRPLSSMIFFFFRPINDLSIVKRTRSK